MVTVVVSAGHSIVEEGAVSGDTHESILNMQLRDQLVKQLNALGIATISVSDRLNLRETIKFIHGVTYDAAIEIHFNAGPAAAHGVEAFHKDGDSWGRQLCTQLCSNLSIQLVQHNRGPKSETQSFHKRLGFVHENPRCVLIEAAFVTNREDVACVMRGDDGELWAAIVAKTIADHLSGERLAQLSKHSGCLCSDPGCGGKREPEVGQ